MRASELGKIMIEAVGIEECDRAYQSRDPFWIGFNALEYGDINRDGTLN